MVKTCFAANASMHKALRDAFESFCNKSIASTSTAELLATFADLQLRKGEKLSEEEVERTLEKVVKLLVYINDRDIFACAPAPAAARAAPRKASCRKERACVQRIPPQEAREAAAVGGKWPYLSDL